MKKKKKNMNKLTNFGTLLFSVITSFLHLKSLAELAMMKKNTVNDVSNVSLLSKVVFW